MLLAAVGPIFKEAVAGDAEADIGNGGYGRRWKCRPVSRSKMQKREVGG